MDTGASIFYTAGLPAIVSMGNTICYFLLKLFSLVFHAISDQAKTRVAKDPTAGGKPGDGATMQEESHPQVFKQISGSTAETRQYGREPKRPDRSILLSLRGKTYASLPLGIIQGIEQSPLFMKMQKDCEAEGIKIPKNIMAKDPRAHIITPQEYLKKVADGTMPQMNNHEMLKEMAEKAAVNNTTQFVMMDFRNIECPQPPKTPGPQKRK